VGDTGVRNGDLKVHCLANGLRGVPEGLKSGVREQCVKGGKGGRREKFKKKIRGARLGGGRGRARKKRRGNLMVVPDGLLRPS